MANTQLPSWKHPISRRRFLTISAAAFGFVASSGWFLQDGFTIAPIRRRVYDKDKIVSTAGTHNCGGRCLLKAHVRDGRIMQITTDDEIADSPQTPQLRGCLRCRGYRDRLYHTDRLNIP